MVFQCINNRQVPLEVLKTEAEVFNTFHGTWRMLMHEKTCLIPIFLGSSSFGVSGSLYFLIVPFPGYLHLPYISEVILVIYARK